MGTRRQARRAAQQHKHRQPNSMPHMAADNSKAGTSRREHHMLGVQGIHAQPQRLDELPVTLTTVQISCEYLNRITASYTLLDVHN